MEDPTYSQVLIDENDIPEDSAVLDTSDVALDMHGDADEIRSVSDTDVALQDTKKTNSKKLLSDSGSFNSVIDSAMDSLDTFSFQSSRSPITSGRQASPISLGSDSTSPRSSMRMILREDSFDRKKLSYKTTFVAKAKMDRAKIMGINEYTFLRTLGKGAFAEVKLGTKSKLENETDVVRDLDVNNFERFAIKIIKKNFLQEKRKFQSQAVPLTSARKSTASVSFLPAIDEGRGALEDGRCSALTPPRASGRSSRMKNKKFQKADDASSTSTSTSSSTPGAVPTTPPASSAPPRASSFPRNMFGTESESGDYSSGVDDQDKNHDHDNDNEMSPLPSSSDSSAAVTPSPRAQTSPKHPEPPPVAEEVLQEIEVLKFLRHKNLVKLCEIIDDPSSKHLYIVMEYVEAGPIMVRRGSSGNFISRLTNGVLLESMACRIFRDLVSVLEYLHLNHIAHRDLKPDNLLVDFRGNLKVSDFGVSSHFSGEKQKKAVNVKQLSRSKSRGVVNSTEGTFAFYSPEMCRENSGAYSAYMSDVWAASVCLWIFVFGKLPLYTADIVDLFAMIRQEQPVKPHRVSPELEHLLDATLQKDQEKRLCLHDIQHHCWLKRVPLALTESGIVGDDLVIHDAGASFNPYIFSRRIRATIIRWARRARERCSVRSAQFVEETHVELVSMLRRSSIPFKSDDQEEVTGGDSSDDDDPLARMVSYDDINGTLLDDIKKHDERQAAMRKLASLAEGDEERRSPAQSTPPQPKKSLRAGRKSRVSLATDMDNILRPSNSFSDNSVGTTPTLELHDRLTQEAIMALELEVFTMQTNKAVKEEVVEDAPKQCCILS